MLHRRMGTRETPRGGTQTNNTRMCFAKNVAARRFLPVLCILVLSAALGACSSDKEPEDTERLGLRVEFTPGTATFSPIDERFASFTVTVSGFKDEADAGSVELGVKEKPAWLSLDPPVIGFSGGVKTFAVVLRYFGTTFTEGSATLQLGLNNIPEGYEYSAGPQTIHVVVAGGQTRDRPIPLTQANIRAFNRYANTEEGLELHYKLVEDVVLEAPLAPETSNWKPIGRFIDNPANPYAEVFTGSFDGNGHTLSGLIIDTLEGNQGLFGVIGQGALIENLGLRDVSVKGNYGVGGLVGSNEGGTVQNSYASGKVEGRDYVGGLMGWNEGGTVQNSYATDNVEGSTCVGGLVGWNNGGAVQNSYATGSVNGSYNVGGLVGYNSGTVQNCVALSPSVTTTANSADNLGRVVGSGDTNLSGNHARSNMDIRYGVDASGNGGDPKALADDGSNSSSMDGQSTSEYNTQSFWTDTWTDEARWDFDTVWQWSPHSLPILRNVGGEQNHTVP